MTYIKDNTTFYKMKVIERLEEQKSSVFDEFRKKEELNFTRSPLSKIYLIRYYTYYLDKCDKMKSVIQTLSNWEHVKDFDLGPVRDRPWEIERLIDIKEL